jgi:phosphatidylserine/phosphatidylglycerophosphate/cardiolipin synthase-like enzyme
MKDDPVIARIRDARHRISEACGHDPNRLVEYYLRLQEKHPERLLQERREAVSTQGR